MLPFARNTLLSGRLGERISALPRDADACAALAGTVRAFEAMRARASEIQTELHLVKPILKTLGYVFESKPQFFEERIKGPDFALFRSEKERAISAPLWGTKQYYERALAVLLVKRYGRDLREGISGFYLEFENRIPLYQSIYLAKKTGVPWSILTNGKSWLLLKRPSVFEKPLVEIDLERAVAEEDEMTVHLFNHIFSSAGLGGDLGALLEEERTELIAYLAEKRRSLHDLKDSGKDGAEAAALALYRQLFAEQGLTVGGGAGPDNPGGAGGSRAGQPAPVRAYDQCDIFTYLFVNGREPEPDCEEIVLHVIGADRTKERLLSLRILDMTPGFGALGARLVETMAYLSFLLPYREGRAFIAEWENETLLHQFILSRVLYGVEKHPFPLDVLQNSMRSRFDAAGVNYRLGNPLLGMSTRALGDLSDVMSRVREMERLVSTLSDRIKEDAAVKGEIEARLLGVLRRIGEIMDLTTALYFDQSLESNKIAELVYYIDGDEEVWKRARATDWYSSAREIARKKHFLHMEVEFPFLLNDGFDLIFVRPALAYVWDERFPAEELAKAYIKRAMTYLKQTGTIVLSLDDPAELASDLRKSKRYIAEVEGGTVLVRRR